MIRFPLLHRLIGAAAIGIGAVPVLAQVPLREEPYINEQLVAVAAGDAIRKACTDITPRMVTVYMKGRALKAYASDLGYTDDQIDSFLDDRAEKTRVRGLAADYLARQGAVTGDAQSYCRVGRAEIERGSLIGSLLKAN